ncbi:histidine kinase [Saccharothrix syringae]|uniref:histidine kinase n=1 Tax=Saccharothrix syringae TaxID=103733 RepID=UPI001885A5C6|nr:histidine kinase [Saccharothrix syringae]
MGFFSRPGAAVRGRSGYLALAAQAGLVFVPMAFYREAWTGMPGFLAGDALLVLRPALGWTTFAAIAAVTGLVQARLTGVPLEVAYIANLTVVVGLAVYGLSRLRSLVRELQDARAELARLAVTRERLRFARDLHDLLGFSLSAITLKCELTHRLVTRQPERAEQEVEEVLGISRQALADVRAVASSYRELSLDDELASARSVLSAAEVAVDLRTDVSQADLSPRVRTVLATVLREGVTNLLRHSKAEHCSITVSRAAREVAIEVTNDGVRAAVTADHGNGIGNLTQRVEALGGTLTARADGDEYRLRASIPLRPDDEHSPDDRDHADRGPAMAPRLGTLITCAVFTGYAVNTSVFVFVAPLNPWQHLLAWACVAGSLALMVGFFSRLGGAVRSPLGVPALLLQAVLTYLPIALFDNPFLGMTGFLAGAALLVLRPRTAIPVFLAVVASAGSVHLVSGGDAIDVGYGFLVTINHGLVVFGLSRLRSMVQKLHDVRTDLVHLAVTEERLRFARSLHDLLGNSLSAITLKCELIHRVVRRDPERAQQELSGILAISRRALTDVRAVAASYRDKSLDEEVASARALLAAANVDVALRVEPGDLPPEVRNLLAKVLREGVANLLRHSECRSCGITLVRRRDRVVLEVVNDGVVDRGTAGAPEACGGLDDLVARVGQVGGTLSAGASADGHYRLRAEVPLSRA